MASTSTSSGVAFSEALPMRTPHTPLARGRAGSAVWRRDMVCRAPVLSRRPASGPTTTARSTPRKVKPIEDTNGYDFVVNTFGNPGERRDVRASTSTRSTRFPIRAGSRIALAAATCRSRRSSGPGPHRSPVARRLGGDGGKGFGCAARLPNDRRRRASSIRSSSIPPPNPEMATGAEIIGTAFYHALGYNVVEVYPAEIDRATLVHRR